MSVYNNMKFGSECVERQLSINEENHVFIELIVCNRVPKLANCR